MTEISISKDEAIRFYQHLQEANNSRVIFSAPFGIGKTSFLKELSKPEHNKKFCPQQDYNFFHIYPVNYSVATNEDIFQYIKYDLIYTLIENKVDFISADFTFLKSLKKYLKSNAHKVAAKLFLFIPHVGKDMYSIFDHLDKVKDEIIEACDDDKKGEEEIFINYLFELQSKSGSVYEMDIYTRLIQNVLQRLKDGGKQNVLIIDDLDRIDPHHIFRLLNIFSAHFDTNGEGNKFGFDKIIFVCDLNNIRKIFAHIYGGKVDFNGYIDKFYSTIVFKFLNYESLTKRIENKLDSHKTKNEIDFDIQDKRFIFDILNSMIKQDKLNYRSAIKINTESVIEKQNIIYRNNRSNFYYCKLLKIAIFLCDVFGSYESLIKILSEMNEIYLLNDGIYVANMDGDIQTYYNKYLIVLLKHKSHNWKQDETVEVFSNTNVFQIKREMRSDLYFAEPLNYAKFPSADKDFWKDLTKSIELLHDKGFF